MKTKAILLTVLASIQTGFLLAADWTQFRGANHDSSTAEKISQPWPAGGPKKLWTAPTPTGFSSMVSGGGKVFTLISRNVNGADQEVCLALDANTGKELWGAALGTAKFDGGGNSGAANNKGGDGPRSTPSVDGKYVYVIGSRLMLFCIDASTGKVVWKKDVITAHAGKNITWENAASPLIDGDLIFMAGGGPGQSLLGINKLTGAVVWKGQTETMTHSTPTCATILGVRQVIFFTQSGLVSVEAKTGKLLWKYPFRYSTSTAMTPVVWGDIVYCSAGYGVGAGACKVTKTGEAFSARQLWFEPANVLNNHWSTPVCKDGFLYGLFGFKDYANCPLKCVEIATGHVLWSKEGFGPGGTILAGGQLLVLGDAGQIVLADANPKEYKELARAQVLAGKCWSTPMVSGGKIYARSTKEAVCLDVQP